jgi:hypothetical protein
MLVVHADDRIFHSRVEPLRRRHRSPRFELAVNGVECAHQPVAFRFVRLEQRAGPLVFPEQVVEHDAPILDARGCCVITADLRCPQDANRLC